MNCVDILVVNALPIELEAVVETLHGLGLALDRYESQDGVPCLIGTLSTREGPRRVALARPTRMGAVPVAATAASLVAQMRPSCLGMSGVCAGNPSDVALGDVVVAEFAYTYDEGKRSVEGFQADHRQVPLSERWQRHAQELPLDGLPSFGPPDNSDRRIWLLEQLASGANPVHHPARARYLAGQQWESVVRELESDGEIELKPTGFKLTRAGRKSVAERRAYDMTPIQALPFVVHVGPIASGNAVVKDGVTWNSLKRLGVRTVLGLEMEAAAISQVAHRLEVPHWIVAKGVMDYADPNKNDRFKQFAAAASAQVLMRFFQTVALPISSKRNDRIARDAINTIGDVSGSNINISQTTKPSRR